MAAFRFLGAAEQGDDSEGLGGAIVERVRAILCSVAVATLLWGCAKEEPKAPTGPGPDPEPDTTEVIIVSACFAGPPIIPFESDGDIWLSTWGDDDLLYITWGDGGGPGQQFDDPIFGTDAGVAALEGIVPEFTNANSPFECVRSIHVPDGIGWSSDPGTNDKPSSILCLDGRLYFAGHTPLGAPDYGYIAYSDDYGLSWTEVPNSPWTAASDSPFRILMLINMGRNYELNEDGYVYGLGIGHEWYWPSGEVALCRVPKAQVAEYDAYEYYAGADSIQEPIWSDDQAEAAILPDLVVHQLSSAIFHEGARRYILLTNMVLYTASRPWGPWEPVRLEDTIYNDLWAGGYMPGIIAKDAGPDYFYFTLAGQDSVIGYFCHMGKIQLQLAEVIP